MSKFVYTDDDLLEIEEPVSKHGTHDQKTHGSWATGGEGITNVQTGEPKSMGEVTPGVVGTWRTESTADYQTQEGEKFTLTTRHEKIFDGMVNINTKVEDKNGKTIGVLGAQMFQPSYKMATITGVKVVSEHQRKGIATAMLAFARANSQGIPIQHSGDLSAEGRAWSDVNKHGEHDQSTHGSWATGSQGSSSDGGGFKDYGSQPQEFYQHYESTYRINGSLINSVTTYQQAGATINDEMRRKWDSADEDSKKLVLEIDSAIDDSLPLDENTILYRGMRGQGISDFEVGDVLTDKAYMSTTVHKEFADGWANNLTSGYIIKIEAQAGQKGLITNFYTADTMLTDEYEYLLPRNTSIEITSMYIKNKTVGAKIVNN